MTATGAGTLILGTSWKMTKTLPEATAYVDALVAHGVPDGVTAFVLPAHTALAGVRDRLPAGSGIVLGAQDAHWGPEGPGTGQVSMRMVADAGAQLVLVGHHERRAGHGETDEHVARKVASALAEHLVPLVCVGEDLAARTAGRAEQVVAEQVEAALSLVPAEQAGPVWIAYEPVWAIGTGARPARPEEVAPVVATIRAVLAARGRSAACRVLYGGSVDESSALSLLAGSGVDGLFVGRAAWDAEDFCALLRLCAARDEPPLDTAHAHQPTTTATT